ncbi:hypothetical protein IAT38_000278 [Cryptococcus sp. DSM 104549]
MLALRSQRQVALRLVRSSSLIATHPCECDAPHAESSSAPSRRAFSSSNMRKAAPAKSKTKKSKLAVEALDRARRLAEALQAEKGDGLPSSSESNTGSKSESTSDTGTSTEESETHPSSTTTTAPTLDDLLAKQPPAVAPYFPWHDKYLGLYVRIYHSVDSAFTTEQMRQFATELNLPFDKRDKKSKAKIIEKVLYDWGWAAPGEEPIMVTKEKIFDLLPSDLYLLLQHSDVVERAADDRNVGLAVVPAPEGYLSAHPASQTGEEHMVLVATGLPKALAEMSDIIKKASKAIHRDSIPQEDARNISKSPAIIDMVSSVAGAYVEPTLRGTYRIAATEQERIGLAKRLLVMAASRSAFVAKDPLHIITPKDSNASVSVVDGSCSFFPTAASTNEPFPWDLLPSTSGQTLFRLRKVWPWAVKPGARGLDQEVEDLAASRVTGVASEKSTLLALANKLTGGKPKLTARFGHLLFPVASATALWDAPLPHKFPLETAREWMASEAEGNRPLFAPRLTPAMVHFPLSNPPRTIRRLRYRSSSPTGEGDAKVINITGDTAVAVRPKAWANKVEDMLDNMVDGSQKPAKETDWLAEVLQAERKKLNGGRDPAEVEEAALAEEAFEVEETTSFEDAAVEGEEVAPVEDVHEVEATLSVEDIDEADEVMPVEYSSEAEEAMAEESPETSTTVPGEDSTASPIDIGEAALEEAPGMTADGVEVSEEGAALDQAEVVPTEEENPVVVQAEMEVYNETSVFFPDRPVDFKLIASSTQTVPTEDIPEDVVAVFRPLNTSTPSFPPLSVTIGGEIYRLDTDEEVKIKEKVVGPVVSRILQVKEVGTRKALVSFNELELTQEGGDIPSASLFWEELAKVTRDVGPDASALEKSVWRT